MFGKDESGTITDESEIKTMNKLKGKERFYYKLL